MANDRSPIIPIQFVPLLENACKNNPAKAAFLVLSLLEAWRGKADETEVPSEYLDAWLALQGNLRTIEARVDGGKKGGRPPKTSDAGGSQQKTSDAGGFDNETTDASCARAARLGEARLGEERRGKAKKEVVDGEFDTFWEAYGRRGGRKEALAAFVKAKKSKTWPGLEVVLAKVAEWRKSDQWTKDGGQFQPHASTWLNNERWDEEPPKKQNEEPDFALPEDFHP